MSCKEQSFLDYVNANNWAVLYRCRCSSEEAEAVVPQLISLLSSNNRETVDEALRALFRIGPPALDAAPKVAELVDSTRAITKSLAIQALGQIAHHKPRICVTRLQDILADDAYCREVMRILAYIGPAASDSLDAVLARFSSSDAKVRKAVVTTALAVSGKNERVTELLRTASKDRSKIVRAVADKALGDI